MLSVRQFPSAAIVIIAASLSFSCEMKGTKVQAGYNIQPGPKSPANRKGNDAAFLAEVANDLLLESRLADLAVRRATSHEIKELAISVLTDHSIAMDELREIAAGIDVPLREEMSAGQRKHFISIAKKQGPKFDREFCQLILTNKAVALKKFEKIAEDGNNEAIRDWAFGKLGVLKRHIALAQGLEAASNASADVGSIME
jgi:putative membrane protein